MEDIVISSKDLRIQSKEDVSNAADGSSVVSSSVIQRRIEFHPAIKSFTGLGNTGAGCDFRIETLNPDFGRKRSSGSNNCQTGKKVDGSEFVENGLDPELSFGISLRKIGAGLENLGNTCFLNSVLQCLTYTEPLAAYLQSGKHQNSCHVAGFCALCAIQKHVSRALQSTGRSLVPKDLVSNLRCISRKFRNARQEDAHEYMVNLLESMHKCCLPSGVPSESPAAYEKSLVHKIFGGCLRSQVECQQCLYCSNKFDAFLDLSLEIVKADSLPVAIRNFTAAELLDGGEKHYQCQRCKQKVKAKKRLTVHKAPYVLTIHLKRFHAHDPGRKVDKKVLFDRSLDIKPFVSGSYEGDLKYSLYGVLVHFGHNTHSGHYVCFVRTSSGIWYLLNDNEVRPVSEKTVLDQKAYMLFYVRDRKNFVSRKRTDVAQKENMEATAGSNITNLVFKQLSKEPAYNGSVGNISLVAAAINKKDRLNTAASNEIVQKGGQPTVTEGLLIKADTGTELLSSPLPKNLSNKVPPNRELENCLPSSAPSISSKSDDVKVDNAIVIPGAKRCNEASSNGHEPQNSHIGKLATNEASEKINVVLNAEVNGAEKTPVLSLSVDPSEKALNKIDCAKSPSEPSRKSGQGGGFLNECDTGNSLVENGDSSKQNVSELVTLTPSDMTNECLHGKASDCLSHKQFKRKIVKCRIPNMHFGSKLFRASLGLRKKKKCKKSKNCSAQIQNLIGEQLPETNYFPSDVGPSTSYISLSVPLGTEKSQKKRAKSHSKCRCNSLMDTVNEAFEKRNNHNIVVMDKHLEKRSLSVSEVNQQDVSVLPCTESSKKDAAENGMMCMLTRGLEETSVAHWDGIELPQSQIGKSRTMENLRIGYVPDEWDEEYDRGKRKKIRQNKQKLGGANPFQEMASRKTHSKKAMMDRSSSGTKPFRI